MSKPQRTLDSRNLPNDQFGYSAYALVALADPRQVALIDEARARIGSQRVSIPAHVTVRGTFSSIPSLDQLCEQLRETASKHPAVEIRFSAAGWSQIERQPGLYVVRMVCERSTGWTELNEAFDAVIRPQSQNHYPDRYGPHLTLAEECTPEQVETAHGAMETMDIGDGFVARKVQLMGRVGPAHGGEWQIVETFSLSS